MRPNRCGHLDGNQVVDVEYAVRRVSAAVDRAKQLVVAGVRAIFPEALMSLSKYETVRRAVGEPLLANMTGLSKTPLLTVIQLDDVGVDLLIWPVSLLRIAMSAADRTLDTLLTTQRSLCPRRG